MNMRRHCLLWIVVLGCAAWCHPAGADDLSITRYLDPRSHSFGRIAPDGSEVVFLDRITGTPQAWLVETEGRAWPRQLTFFDERVQSAYWSPAPGELILTKDSAGNERSQLYWAKADGSELRRLTHQDDVIHHLGDFDATGRRIVYRSNARNRSTFDLYLMDLDTGASELVYEGKRRTHVSSFAPDGAHLLLQHTESSRENGLSLLDLTTGEDRWLTPTDRAARFYYHHWTADRRGVWLVTDYGRDLPSVARLDFDTGELTFPRDDRWPVDRILVSRDGRRMAVAFNENGFSRLELIDPETQETFAAPDLTGGVISGMDMTPDGSKLLLAMGSSVRPSELHVYDVDAGQLSWVTRGTLAGIPEESLVRPRLMTYESFDGLEISGFVYDGRTDRSAPAPCVVYVHGGPESQRRPRFSGLFQYLAGRGYVVFAPNVRGSSGYGRHFMSLDDGDKREDSVKDVIAGVDALVADGVIDRHRVGIYGASYGGYMVLACLTLYPERFACGVDRVGISNFVTFLENTGAYRRALREEEYGSLEHDRAMLESISPIHRVDAIQAPLFVIHGDNDPRVPIGEALQIVEAMRERNRPVEFMRLGDEGHGVTKEASRDAMYTRLVDFMATYLNPAPAAGEGVDDAGAP